MAELQHLTATVHIIKIGAQDLTISKYRQLDHYAIHDGLQHFHAFGRINLQNTRTAIGGLDLIGRNNNTGELIKLQLTMQDIWDMENHSIHKQLLKQYEELPLIILGGMK
jgi:hypothetical protein